VAVVIDSNLLVVLATSDPRRPAVKALFDAWETDDEELHAPSLIRYEIANAFTRLLVGRLIAEAQMTAAWEKATAVPVTLHELSDGPSAVKIAVQLRRESAYDAAYLALAARLETHVWTLDGPLARNAAGSGLPVRLVDGR
jgi:predicted nucleic acid-binding protein